MQRRDFIALLGGVFSWPFAAHAQQKAMPVIGYLSQRSPTDSASIVAAFHQGLSEQGYVEGQTSSPNLALLKDKSIACRGWRAIWFGMA